MSESRESNGILSSQVTILKPAVLPGRFSKAQFSLGGPFLSFPVSQHSQETSLSPSSNILPGSSWEGLREGRHSPLGPLDVITERDVK